MTRATPREGRHVTRRIGVEHDQIGKRATAPVLAIAGTQRVDQRGRVSRGTSLVNEMKPHQILRSWDIVPDSVALVSTTSNTHWKVQAGASSFILRACRAEHTAASISFEHAVLRHLHDRAWPVAVPIGAPTWHEDRAYVLFPLLAGTPRVSEDGNDMRTRGRILARLHHDLSGLADVLGQRPGWLRADEVVTPDRWHDLEQRLDVRIVAPEMARALRLQIDQLGESLTGTTRSFAITIAHGDLIAQNVLFRGPDLSGVIDFDSAHMNFRAADIACARRSRHDDVVRGYLETSALSDAELGCIGDLWRASVFQYVWQLLRPMRMSDVARSQLSWCLKQLEQTRPFTG